MAITMHSASVPIFVRMLENLSTWLDKAEAHGTARKIDPAAFMQARLAPDMLPFTKQIQIACDAAKFGVARLAGVEAPRFADDEASFELALDWSAGRANRARHAAVSLAITLEVGTPRGRGVH